MSALRWSIDSLVVRGNTVFGFGWMFHPASEIRGVSFGRRRFDGAPSQSAFIRADFGKPREDVAKAFPDSPAAMNSGFVVLGEFLPSDHAESLVCEVHLAGGEIVRFPVPPTCIAHFDAAEASNSGRLLLSQLLVFFKRGLHLARERKFSSLFEKVRHYLKGRPKVALHGSSELGVMLAAHGVRDMTLIVDHDLGGGANHYRDRMVEAIVRSGRTALVFTFHVATLTHMLIIRGPQLNTRIAVPSKRFLAGALAKLSIAEIVYNTGVSFAQPEELPGLILRIKDESGARLKIMGHDYFTVCPSHFLLNDEARYCGIPDSVTCSQCLQKNQQGFTALYSERSIQSWRRLWGGLLSKADEIVVFSHDSERLLKRAYPNIRNAQIRVTPHVIEHLKDAMPCITNTAMLHIGIVGHIGPHKGASFVRSLAEEIKLRAIPVKISIIGAIETQCDPTIVTQTGAYRHPELQGILECSGANIMLFPSICPETFSYVVQELIEMQLPVASFNLGAPAERLTVYSKGKVLKSMDPSEVLNELISFHQEIYQSN